ncbi:MAG: alkaline phosphatase family protein [Bacteroidetes bacterium]|nr:MAG: alkaline phosphatase family protein [Bacteroidota bacterium]
MKKIWKYYRGFVWEMAAVFVLYQLFRLIFVWFNMSYLTGVQWRYFVEGIWFDAVAVFYLFLPFILLSILPVSVKIKQTVLYKSLKNVFFYLGITVSLLLNLTDVIYFRFTLRRTTREIIELLVQSSDVWGLIPRFFLDYWYILLLFGGFLTAAIYFHTKVNKDTKEDLPVSQRWAAFIFFSLFFIICARGGFGYKPLMPVDAYKYASGNEVNVVLNTSFTFLKSFEQPLEIDSKHYFLSEKEMEQYFNPKQQIRPMNIPLQQPNIVLLILESFGKEYVSYFNKKHHLTPFLDSLFARSAVFRYSFANGRRSIEALPSIFISVPALSNNPLITSEFVSNQFESFPDKLKTRGYYTAFFHGAKNGSMNFDAFTKSIGFDEYFGMNEYTGAEEDFDGNWGIFDEPFLQYTVEKLTNAPKPFFASVFTLSSHHPFKIPEKYNNRFNGKYDNLPIAPTVEYTDYALAQFFKKLKKQPFFDNTLFIITADHTSLSKNEYFKQSPGNFAVPIAFYHPKIPLKNYLDTNILIEHKDIMPTLLSMLQMTDSVYAFGTNIMQTKTVGMHYINYQYEFIFDSLLVRFFNDSVQQIYYYQHDSMLRNNMFGQLSEAEIKEISLRSKAIIQTYQSDLLHNRMNLNRSIKTD